MGTFERGYVIGECVHRRATGFTSNTGYRCEKHGGGRNLHTHISNGSTEITSKKHRDCKNGSSPSVPALLNASCSDTGV